MKHSEWIAIGGIATGLFASIIGSAIYLSFKIGGVNEKVNSLEIRMTSVEDSLTGIKEDVRQLQVDVAEIRVKVDVLWEDKVPKK